MGTSGARILLRAHQPTVEDLERTSRPEMFNDSFFLKLTVSLLLLNRPSQKERKGENLPTINFPGALAVSFREDDFVQVRV